MITMNEYQLDFFKDSEICRLESEIKETKESAHRVRKALFARLSELHKKCDDLLHEHEVFKRELCRGNK